ncbi:zinc-dependent alcohol dehydrogenase family protein [Candidatus Laterigemmans baculatus]|uniref:zinc-dependent alcohol dehydrogenase family protein n=1 Tax=Candidatus Laterigemmans baculatus TaxID=2770505 RepID=UPI0013DD7CB1|nr:NAD(P)-dependent alcohol dehydrogenase [Candidatus Laterigemmans baculatus]
MFRYELASATGLDGLRKVDFEPAPLGPTEVRIAPRAWSLNFRDLAMPRGGYPGNRKIQTDPPLVPLSDAAGEVVEVGAAVRRFAVGDRVCPCFFPDWVDGELEESQLASALGGAADGVLAETVRLPEHGLVRMPANLSFEEAACLPCAAVTAWQALMLARLTPGQTILTLGTGGVSIFALQIAKLAGARVIITSSSDEKLERARELGADACINYATHPDWDVPAREWTGGVGVDNVIEVGGAGTLERSLRAARVSGAVSLIGILTSPEQNPSPMLALFKRLTIQGIYVGSRVMFEALCRAIEAGDLHPVIDKTFGCESVDDVRAAYQYLKSGSHFGKIVIAR